MMQNNQNTFLSNMERMIRSSQSVSQSVSQQSDEEEEESLHLLKFPAKSGLIS